MGGLAELHRFGGRLQFSAAFVKLKLQMEEDESVGSEVDFGDTFAEFGDHIISDHDGCMMFHAFFLKRIAEVLPLCVHFRSVSIVPHLVNRLNFLSLETFSLRG